MVLVKLKKSIKIAIISFISFIILVFGCFYIYTLDYYRAEDVSVPVNTGGIKIDRKDNMRVFHPDPDKVRNIGYIFYPGGKVEALAYQPLLTKLAEYGITSVLLEMPFNLAVFQISAADKVYNELQDIKKWYIGGHSLGGAMASSYAEKNSVKVSGLILLGAYSVNDTPVPTLAIYGSEDLILDKSKLTLIDNEVEITGGNHAYFGNYGEQDGDGTAGITRDEQQQQTVEAIVQFIEESEM